MNLLLPSEARLFFALFVVAIVGMGTLMPNFMCSPTMNFACPSNRLKIKVRGAFIKRNPTITKAWKGDLL